MKSWFGEPSGIILSLREVMTDESHNIKIGVAKVFFACGSPGEMTLKLLFLNR